MPSCAVSVHAGLQLRHALDLAEAHAAGADRRPEPRLVAEDGDLDPGRERRLDEPGALRHLHLDVVDRERDELGRAHADAFRTVGQTLDMSVSDAMQPSQRAIAATPRHGLHGVCHLTWPDETWS